MPEVLPQPIPEPQTASTVGLEVEPARAVARPAEDRPGRRLHHIPELDGLRGIAALLVFFHHACFTSVPSPRSPVLQALRSAAVFGNGGVDLFFVLSGFLITTILLGDRQKPRYYAPFYWKRVLRIVPVYAFVLLYVVLFRPHNNIAVLCAAFFVANFSLFLHIAPVSPFWSLAIEEQFYLVWPTLVHRRSVDALRRWAIGIALGCMLLRVIAAGFGHFNYFLTFLHCDGLALGALLACFYVDREEHSRSARRAAVGSLVVGCLLVVVNRLVPQAHLVPRAMSAAAGITGVTLLSFAVVGVLVFRSGATWLGIFRSRVLTFFGMISYAFYMVHLYVLQAVDQRMSGVDVTQTGAFLLRVLLILAASVAVATMSRYLLELPVQSLRRYVPALRPAGAPKPKGV